MLREVIRPQHNSFTINIPNSYIDREIEFIMFPLDNEEITKIEDTAKSSENITNSLYGALKNSNINKSDYKDYLETKYL
ncbi:MAG: hypothetical protein GQ570_10970 [Helicobacteraceae bacterium]|nr:hypothetical protein [Helicobacteraceae bacterium]